MSLQILNSSGTYVIFFVLENIEEKILLGEMNKKLNFSSLLICSLSHELQTPVHHLLSSSQAMEEYFRTGNASVSHKTDKAREDCNLVLKSCLGLSMFIQNLLDFARYFNGCLKAAPEDFEVESVLNEVMQIFSIKTAKKKIKVSIECQKGLMIYSDKLKFMGIVYTFLENSVKFTMRGEIKLRVTNGHLPRFIRVEVVDTGIGISPDDISNLLRIMQNPFEDVTTRGAAGISLGMRIAQILLVCLTGGDMDFQIVSEKGSGTTVRFELLRRMRTDGGGYGGGQMKRATTKVEEAILVESEAKEQSPALEEFKLIKPERVYNIMERPKTDGDKIEDDVEGSGFQYSESLASEDDGIEENMSATGELIKLKTVGADKDDDPEADIPKSAMEEKIYDQPPPTLVAGFIGQIQTRLIKKKMYTGKVRLRNSTSYSSQGMLKQAQSIASSSKGKRSSIRGSSREVNIRPNRNFDKQPSTHISNYFGSDFEPSKFNSPTIADFMLPRRHKESIMMEIQDDEYEALRTKVAIVVDDEVINADIMQGWLETLRLEVYVAYEGELAIELCNRLLTLGKTVDVIFLDYSMPLMNGDECSKILRSPIYDSILRDTKIVGLTAHRDPDIRQKCLDAGMDMVEYKPILKDRIRSILVRLDILEE